MSQCAGAKLQRRFCAISEDIDCQCSAFTVLFYIMLLIKTKIAVSSIHGIGLFADEFVPKGTVTWQFNPIIDVGFTDEEIAALPEVARKTFLHYTYFDKDLQRHILCADDQRFINHSTSGWNIESTPHKDIAARDIAVGEELLCDYYKFDDTYFDQLNIKRENLK